jgi:hypothetical protein
MRTIRSAEAKRSGKESICGGIQGRRSPERYFFILVSKPPEEKNIDPENAGRKRTMIL